MRNTIASRWMSSCVSHQKATSRLWNHYREGLLKLRESPGLEPHYHATEQAGQELKQAVECLLAVLRETHEKLSVDFDVPFVAEVPLLR